MSVDTKHREYNLFKDKWSKCRDANSGEEAIKAKETVYLPKLSGQNKIAYSAYLDRALWYGATNRTILGLLGTILRKPLTVSSTMQRPDMEKVTIDKADITSLARVILKEQLITGRCGVLVDSPQTEDGQAFLSYYIAENIINWETTDGILTTVVLKEEYTTVGEDRFELLYATQYRVLELVKNVKIILPLGQLPPINEYTQTVYRQDGKSWNIYETIVPKIRGKSLDFIPFQFFNMMDGTSTMFDPPLLPLVNVNISHFRSSADLEHGRHFTGLPTPWFAGFDVKGTIKIGSETAYVAEDPQSKAGYLEFKGEGLKFLENALEQKQNMMVVLGARMLETPKKAVEASETIQTRLLGENNILTNISISTGYGLTKVCQWLAEWRAVPGQVLIELNTDFMTNRMSPEEQTSLVQSWQSGAISYPTLFHNLQKGEIIPHDRTEEEEKESIDNDIGSWSGSCTRSNTNMGEEF